MIHSLLSYKRKKEARAQDLPSPIPRNPPSPPQTIPRPPFWPATNNPFGSLSLGEEDDSQTDVPMTPIIPEENEDKQDFDKKVKSTKIKRNKIGDTKVARKKDNEKVRQSRLSDPRKKANPFKPAEPRRPQTLRRQSVPQPRSPRSLSESEVGELGQPQDSKAVRSDSRSKAERIDSIQLGDLGPPER